MKRILLTFALLIGSLFVASPAEANAACPNNRLCFYQCYLAFNCSVDKSIASTTTSCVKTYPGANFWSVKNETGYNFKVWHNSNCQNGTGGTSVLYAETDGNLNVEWRADGIASVQRLLN